MFENVIADIERHYAVDEKWEQFNSLSKLRTLLLSFGLHASTVYRLGHFLETRTRKAYQIPIRFSLSALYHLLRVFIEKSYGIYIDRRSVIGKGLYIGHFGGIRIGICRIGENCSVHQQVVIGDTGKDRTGGPWLGNRVWICPHATIRNNVRLGDDVTVAAGSRVLNSCGDHCLIAGDPARIVLVNYDNSGLLKLPPNRESKPEMVGGLLALKKNQS